MIDAISRLDISEAKWINASAGVYIIFIGDYYYIGAAQNVRRKIKRQYRFCLQKKHQNRLLQKAYNSIQTFEFAVISITETQEDLITDHVWALGEFADRHYCLNSSVNAQIIEKKQAL